MKQQLLEASGCFFTILGFVLVGALGFIAALIVLPGAAILALGIYISNKTRPPALREEKVETKLKPLYD